MSHHMPACENRRDKDGKSGSRIGPEENRVRTAAASSHPYEAPSTAREQSIIDGAV